MINALNQTNNLNPPDRPKGTLQRYRKKDGSLRVKAHVNWAGRKHHVGTFGSDDDAWQALRRFQETRKDHADVEPPEARDDDAQGLG